MSDRTVKRRVLCVVMDGIGVRNSNFGNAVNLAKTPTLDWLREHAFYTTLKAHGTAVGLPSDDDIGNSEVGHNALGAGRVFAQGAKLVQQAIQTESLFEGATWQNLIKYVGSHEGTLHLMGLLSNGNVHSHEQHLYSLMRHAKAEGLNNVRIHVLFDGRDVGEKTAEIYIQRLNEVINELNDANFDIAVASAGGRMAITMDRYNADWSMVKKGWDTHVLGKGTQYSSLESALGELRKDPKLTDQNLPPFVIANDGQPVGPINDGDGVVFFNFRGDRAIEISRAFTEIDFDKFDRERFPQVFYAGMMQYDGDLHIPEHYLVEPPEIDFPLTEYLLKYDVRQFACSETQKFGHVTYFWNGNRSGYINKIYEEYVEVPSDSGISFDEKPDMKAKEIADATIERMRNNSFDFGRINFANGDMVGHTGNLPASIHAVEVVDQQIRRLLDAADQTGYIVLITADHGNADEMFDAKEKDFPGWSYREDKAVNQPKPKTAHTLAPVPCYIYDPVHRDDGAKVYSLNQQVPAPALANVANTIITLMCLPSCERYLPSFIEMKG